MRALPLVPREPSVRPGQGLLFPLESVFTLKGNVQEEQESIYSAGQGVEASSVDVCKLVHTSEHYIKIACVLKCQQRSREVLLWQTHIKIPGYSYIPACPQVL